MDELKACRFTRKEKSAVNTLKIDNGDGAYILKRDADAVLHYIKFLQSEVERLSTHPENKPLSLEELRQMDNQPVWTDKRCGVVRVEPGITRRPGMPAIYFNYGWEWADDVLACGSAYAHKPEQEGK